MKITPQTNTTIKRFALLVIFGAMVACSGTAIARADGVLTDQEKRFGDGISTALCDYLDTAGVNNTSMTKSIEIIYTHTPSYMDMTDAADIINYVVYNYCPSHWSELVAFGEGARGSHV